MKRRVMMGKRELVEVVEELKSSGTWMVPAGCKFVDVFIVGGGGSGASSGPERGGGGGGSGYVKTYLDVPVTPESVVSYSIGKGGDRVVSMSAYDDQKNGLPGSESWFKSNSIKALGDIPEEGAMGDQVVVVEDLQKRRQDILVEVMVLMEQVICLESVKGVLPDARSIINCTPEVVEVVENIVPDQHQVAVVSVMSEIFREDLLMENPIRAQEEVLFI